MNDVGDVLLDLTKKFIDIMLKEKRVMEMGSAKLFNDLLREFLRIIQKWLDNDIPGIGSGDDDMEYWINQKNLIKILLNLE